MHPPFRLDLLGDPAFVGPGGPVRGRAAHKRRVALLAVLAVARSRPVGRDRLMGLLWPELSGEAARHNLSESLYVLRKELGDAAVNAALAGDVTLNPNVVASDVAEFQNRLDAGDAEGAVALYGGPLLDGFYVADAPEFERWVQGERDRLSRAFGRALEELATAAEAEGSVIRAVDWWRRLAAHDPYSSRTALRLVRALHAAGERASALRAAEAHAVLLREELGVEPDADLQAFVQRLRAEPARPAAPDPLPLPAASEAPEADGDASPRIASTSLIVVPPQPVALATRAAVDSAPRRGPVPARRRRGALTAVSYAAMGGVVLGMLLSFLTGWDVREGHGAGTGHDPRHIAVLYFEDLSPGGELQYLAAGLTERLIHELSQAGALDVVSRGGVRPYRDAAVPLDSLAAALGVGSVVEGTVQRSGDSVWVTVALVDPSTQRHLQSREIGRPLGDLVALERAVAGEVAAALRRRLGQEVRLRAAEAETHSPVALQRVMQAEQLRREAREMAARTDSLDAASATRLFLRADSLLALAQDADPRWPQPPLLRGWLEVDRAVMLADGDARWAVLRAARRRADQVLQRGPAGRVAALELRGTALWMLGVGARDSARQRVWLDSAEADLRAVTAADPARAAAWSRLSQLLRVRGRLAEADMAARRALAEDAWLDDAADIRNRLFYSALWQADYPLARDECEAGRAQFPADFRFTECRLTLLRNDRARPPDPAQAWRLVAELDRIDSPGRARAQGRGYAVLYRRMVAAAVSARAGHADSARAVVARARREVGADPALGYSLDYDEAWVHAALGDTAAARTLVRRMLDYRPAMRAYLLRDPFVAALISESSPKDTGTACTVPSRCSVASPGT